MKTACEKCEKELPANQLGARICSYECTWCDDCAAVMHMVCPNCSGDLVVRPRRA